MLLRKNFNITVIAIIINIAVSPALWAQTDNNLEGNDGIIIIDAPQELDEILEKYQNLPKEYDYNAFQKYSLSQVQKYNDDDYNRQNIAQSALLKPGFTKNADFHPCHNRAFAAIVDMDNDPESNEKRPIISEHPAHKKLNIRLGNALMALRDANINIIWLSDKPKSQEKDYIAYLRAANLTDERDFLAFKNDDSKQERRQYIASRFCVISILGDRVSDFDILFKYLRNPDQFTALNKMFEKGWFIRNLPDFTPQ